MFSAKSNRKDLSFANRWARNAIAIPSGLHGTVDLLGHILLDLPARGHGEPLAEPHAVRFSPPRSNFRISAVSGNAAVPR